MEHLEQPSGAMEHLEQYRVHRAPHSVYYIPNFLPFAEEAPLQHSIYGAPKPKWTVLSQRRLQNWGGLPHTRGMVSEPLPPWLQRHTDRVSQLGVFGADRAANHVLINEYTAGQGIMAHVDGPLFHPVISTLTVGGHTLLNLYRTAPPAVEGDQEESSSLSERFVGSLLLERCSLLIIQHDAYTSYLHDIRSTTADIVNSDRVLNWSQTSLGQRSGLLWQRIVQSGNSIGRENESDLCDDVCSRDNGEAVQSDNLRDRDNEESVQHTDECVLQSEDKEATRTRLETFFLQNTNSTLASKPENILNGPSTSDNEREESKKSEVFLTEKNKEAFETEMKYAAAFKGKRKDDGKRGHDAIKAESNSNKEEAITKDDKIISPTNHNVSKEISDKNPKSSNGLEINDQRELVEISKNQSQTNSQEQNSSSSIETKKDNPEPTSLSPSSSIVSLQYRSKSDNLESRDKSDNLESAAKSENLESAAKSENIESAAKSENLESAAKSENLESAAKSENIEPLSHRVGATDTLLAAVLVDNRRSFVLRRGTRLSLTIRNVPKVLKANVFFGRRGKASR